MPESKALARGCKLRGYSRLRKAELIAFLQSEDRRQEEPPIQQPELEFPQPLTKRQPKRRRNKNSKLNKKLKNLSKEIDNLKSQIEELENKIAQRTNAGFKRKKIRSMKRDVVKAIEKLKESEKSFESIESRIIPKNNNSERSSSKRIENKIAELNKKIRRA